MNKKFALLLLNIFLFCNAFYAQNNEGKQPLVQVFQQLEKQFQYSFSYADKNVKNVSIVIPIKHKTLQEIIQFLNDNTILTFKIIEGNVITVSLDNTIVSTTICGYLIDFDTNDVIQNATIQSKNSATVTDGQGYFELTDISEDDMIAIQHVSYKTVRYLTDKFVKNKCESHYLVPKVERIREVIIRNYLTKGIRKKNDGSFNIDYKNFGILPGLIEADVLQTLQALPGIQSVDETVSNINIRGGSHHENLILWDGIKMYQSGHFFGLISAFNPYLTKNTTLIKNGTNANFSDGVSGTILMNSDNELTHKFKTEIGLNLINADIFLDIPIGRKSSVQVSSRKSINDIVETPTYKKYFKKSFQNTEVVTNSENVISFNNQFSFADYNLRWLYHLTDNDKIRVNLLAVNNELSFLENAIINNIEEAKESKAIQNNKAVGIFYNRIWTNDFSTEVQLYATKYLLESTNFDILNNQRLIQENEVIEESLKLDSEYKLTDKLTLHNGYQYLETGITSLQDVDNPVFRLKVKEVIRSHGLSSQVGYQSTNGRTNARAGLRLNYLEKFGKFLIEPRFNFSHQFSQSFSAEVLGEIKHQTTTQVIDFQNDFLGVENRRWLLSNNADIPIVKSKQGSIGLHYDKKGWLITAEGYYKKVDGITTQSQGFQNQYQFVKTTGSYTVFGADFLINKRFKNVSSWLTYSYVNSDYVFDESVEGKFPSNFDITHSISFAAAYTLRKFKISTGLNWHLGKPTTDLVFANELFNDELNYQAANSSRLDDYFRVDMSVHYAFNFNKKVKAYTGISILNLLNHKNELNRYYQIKNDEVNKITETSLGFTPNINFRISF